MVTVTTAKKRILADPRLNRGSYLLLLSFCQTSVAGNVSDT